MKTSSAAALGGLLLGTAACGSGSDEAARSGGGKLTWWDHYNSLQKLHQRMLADWSKKSGTQVEYSFYQGKKLAEALQLAKQSNQLPDVHSPSPSMNIPLAALIGQNWFQPLQLSQEARDRLPKDALIEGINVLDGKLYSFPIFSPRWHSASLYINKPILEKAGLDPANPPATWDDFRAACRTIRSKAGGQTYGYMDTEAGEAKLGSLAQTAGFEGSWKGMLYRTGEYALDADPWVNTIEFIMSLQKDGVLYPGSNSTIAADVARGRWVAGGAGFFFDGPWGPGVIAQNFGKFADNVVVGQILTPDQSHKRALHVAPGAGAFFINAQSKHAAAASELLGQFTTKEYYVSLAQSMDQPPLDLSVVDSAEGVHPNYKQLMKWFAEQVFIEPMPVVRNPDVAKVELERKPVNPNFRSVVGGLYTGQVKDVRKALKQLSDKLNQDLDKAIQAAKQKGAKVSREDYAFPDWQPGKDHTNSK